MGSDGNRPEVESESSFGSILERIGEKYDLANWSGLDDEVDRFLNREARSEKEAKRARRRSKPREKHDYLEDESKKAEVWGIEHTSQGWDQRSELPYLARISGLEQLDDEKLFYLCGEIEAGVLAEEALRLVLRGGSSDEFDSQLAKELHQVAAIGSKAFERLINANLKLVAHVSRRYQGLGLELLDLIQWGNIGLIRAAQKFDREKGYKFSTYAFNWIEQSLRRGIAEHSRLIRIPDHAFWRVHSIVSAVDENCSETGQSRIFSEAESKFRDAFPTSHEAILQTAIPIQSLDAPARYMGAEFLAEGEWEHLVDGFEPSLEQQADAALLERQVEWLLEFIPEPLGGVLRMRFGFSGEPKTLEEIGEVFGLTRERIRQLQKKAFEIIARDYSYLDEFEG